MRIAATAPARAHSGIGVIQQAVYKQLVSSGHAVVWGKTRDLAGGSAMRLRGIARGLDTPPRGDVFLSMMSPMPYRVPDPVVAYVYDVRWRRTRSSRARAYRRFDLLRTVRHAEKLVAISQCARDEICEYLPEAESKITVVRPGPGQLDRPQFDSVVPGRLVLMGSATHKRNELAAAALAVAKPPWLGEIVAINVSNETKTILDESPIRSRCEPLLASERLVQELAAAEYFMHAGTEEGFGLPYIEALGLGCQVIAIDQPLTREILGTAGILLKNGNSDLVGEQLRTIHSIGREIRLNVFEQYSWDLCTTQLTRLLESATQ